MGIHMQMHTCMQKPNTTGQNINTHPHEAEPGGLLFPVSAVLGLFRRWPFHESHAWSKSKRRGERVYRFLYTDSILWEFKRKRKENETRQNKGRTKQKRNNKQKKQTKKQKKQ